MPFPLQFHSPQPGSQPWLQSCSGNYARMDAAEPALPAWAPSALTSTSPAQAALGLIGPK